MLLRKSCLTTLFYLKDYSIRHSSETLLILMTIMNAYITSQMLHVECKESFNWLCCSLWHEWKEVCLYILYTWITHLNLFTWFGKSKLTKHKYLFILENTLNCSEEVGSVGRLHGWLLYFWIPQKFAEPKPLHLGQTNQFPKLTCKDCSQYLFCHESSNKHPYAKFL